jgi:uncharacterized repeat protein (TIGR03803 family)
MDSVGNLYGTTNSYGLWDAGVIFELSPISNGHWRYSVLYNFRGRNDGGDPGALVFDPVGNLYGTTSLGEGAIFEMTHVSGRRWNESVLYSFLGNDDGAHPAAGLTFDNTGNLYGTAYVGGANNDGTIFELTPNTQGNWTFNVIHQFDGNDGSQPQAGVSFDADGNAYATATIGGTYGYGTILQGTFTSTTGWTWTVIHDFAGDPDGADPQSGLIFDSTRRFFGTAAGSVLGGGTVFQGTRTAGESWNVEVLYAFTGQADGSYPNGSLVIDSTGALYGVTQQGGKISPLCPTGCGVVFEVVP